jgi:MGT family glycosyltransferase
MACALFINGNLYGHINPTLPVVSELVRRKEDVWYLCSKIFEDKVQACGARFIDLSENIEAFMTGYKPAGNHPFYTLLEYIIRYDEAVLPELLAKIGEMHFDYIVCDSILGAGYFLKNMLDIPVICSNSTFVISRLPVPDRMMERGFHPQLDDFYNRLENMCGKYKVRVPAAYELFTSKCDLNIVYTSKEFNSEDNFDDSYAFVGPSIKDREEDAGFPFDKIKGERVVYISLGTINTSFIDFYIACMRALTNMDCTVIMSVGRKCSIDSLGEIPDNFIVRNYVPQLEILQRTDVFISHGGFNSVSEALYYGVPVITVPTVNDQFMVAKRVMQTGTGTMLKMNEITDKVIADAVSDLLADSKYKDASRRIGQTLQSAGGFEKAADCILALLKE